MLTECVCYEACDLLTFQGIITKYYGMLSKSTTARICCKCGGPAALYTTKRFHAFPATRIYFCEKCYENTEKRGDIILITNLVISAIIAAVAIFLNTAQISGEDKTRVVQEQKKADERDFNGDGFLDLWEMQATGQQIRYFKEIGYPWEIVERGQNPTRAVLVSYPVKDWVELFKNNKEVRNTINFSEVMSKFLARYTDPDSPMQIDRVFLTATRDLAYVLKRYPTPPSQWLPSSSTSTPASSPKGKHGKKIDKIEGMEAFPQAPVAPVEVLVCYERLKSGEGVLLAQIFGIPEDKLPLPYREGK